VTLAAPGADLTQVPLDSSRLEDALAAQREAVRDETLGTLLTWSVVALAVIGVLAVVTGWVMAGRVLHPLHRITATARRVADRTLHERIALDGPRDELRELADTFDAMLDRLDRAFDGQRRFVANASHELRTPLAVNRTLIEIAVGRPGAPEELTRLGESLLAVNARHERLIEGLLTLARSEHELGETATVDLADVAGHVVGTAGVAAVLDLRPAPVTGDPLLLERLVANLVDNARRYNVPGGEVRVSTGTAPGGALLTVVNAGPVVPRHSLPLLFEPFQRLGRSDGTGAGLGLSIVRSVAHAHGGTVTADAREEGGLVVTVALPAAAGPLPELQVAARPAAVSRRVPAARP
jgi:signal transduction histidine kinase